MVAVKEFSWEEISGPDFGTPAGQAWQQAVAQVEAQLHTKLHVEVLPERMRKALDLVRANAVTLHAGGAIRVQSGKQTYPLAPDCLCADAKYRTELCKHTLAVEMHRQALALLQGTAAEPTPPTAPVLTPAAPSASASHAWDVHEAPASACFKFRVGNMELMYTLRGIDDDELQRRITATLPTLQDVIEACEARAAQRTAERDAPRKRPRPSRPSPQQAPQ
jgi:hypothetical protein